MNRMKKYLKRVALALAVFSVASIVPADAYNPAAREGQRPRAGVSTWVPREVDVNSYYDAENDKTIFGFGFKWHQNEHMMDLEGSEQILEINMEIPCYEDALWFVNEWTDGYYRAGDWDTNVPAAALPYEDPMFLDTCDDNNEDSMSVGVGVANVAALVPNTYYWIQVGSQGEIPTNTPHAQNATIKVQTGTTYDHSNGTPIFSSDCSWSAGELANWNGANSTGLYLREEAGFCTWPDFTHTVGTTSTGQFHTFVTDYLENQGLEEDRAPAWGYGVGTGASATKYCNDWTGAFDGNCFVQTTMVGSGSNFYQDRGWGPAGGKTAEVAVRCRDLDGSCTIQLGIWGYNGPGAGSEYSYVMETITTEDPTQWFICRLDADHYTNGYGYSAPNFTQAHNNWRWEVFQHGGSLIDVDYTFFGGKTKITNNAAGGNLNPADQPVCTPR